MKILAEWKAFMEGGKGESAGAGDKDKDTQCCVGLLDITAIVVFKDSGSKTSIGYDATIQVDTVTKCESSITCEDVTGRSDKVPTDGVSDRHTVYTTSNNCERMVKAYNKGTDFTGDRFDPLTRKVSPPTSLSGLLVRPPTAKLGEPYRFKLMKAKNLGCCSTPCPVQHGSKVHDYKGKVPGAPSTGKDGDEGVVSAGTVTDMVDQIKAKFGFGGSIAKPTFKPCCTKKKKGWGF